MLRIGLIGADNFHAKQFSAIANAVEKTMGWQKRVTVAAVYDPDPQAAQALAREHNIGFVAQDPAQLSHHADAVMITLRDGATHPQHALPFLRQGMPVWVDKPLSLTVADAQALCLRRFAPLPSARGRCANRGGCWAGRSTSRAVWTALTMACISTAATAPRY